MQDSEIHEVLETLVELPDSSICEGESSAEPKEEPVMEELVMEETNSETDAPILRPDTSGFIWRVLPTLEYTHIHFCVCVLFLNVNLSGNVIDPETGLLTNRYHDCHCSDASIWLVYDRERNLFV